MQRSVFVTRHGERIDYVDRQWLAKAGHSRSDDPHLSPKGLVQARELAKALKFQSQIKVRHIVSSPFLRCVQTASQVARELGLKVKIEHGICEVLHTYPPNLLPLEDLDRDAHCRGCVELEHRSRTCLPTQAEYDDSECIRRAGKAARDILENLDNQGPPDSVVLFVGHGASCVGILSGLAGEHTYQGFCTLTHLTLEPGQSEWKAEVVGGTSHLSDPTNLHAY